METKLINHKLKFLKVKIKSLAAESCIIRFEKERALKYGNYVLANELQHHKVHAVRTECRASLMAYGLLKGKTVEQIEPGAKSKPDESRVKAMIKKYGTSEDRLKLAA
jgi:cell division protein YceG involved in septum cleavage